MVGLAPAAPLAYPLLLRMPVAATTTTATTITTNVPVTLRHSPSLLMTVAAETMTAATAPLLPTVFNRNRRHRPSDSIV